MAWFNKKTKRIEVVPPEQRVVKTENVFVKCDGCEAHLFKGELEDGLQVCKHCGYHFRIGARERLALLFDDSKFEELDNEVVSIDPLEFADSKPYPTRLTQAKAVSGLPEAIINARGTVGDHPVCAGAMDMLFIGGSMGSAVGEKVTRLIERAMNERGHQERAAGAAMFGHNFRQCAFGKTAAQGFIQLRNARWPKSVLRGG